MLIHTQCRGNINSSTVCALKSLVYVPREISRVVWYFITHGGSVTGTVYSPAYYPSPIAQRGLEILLECEFKIDVKKIDILKRLEEIVDKQYRDPFLNSITPVDCGVDSLLEVEKDVDENEDVIRIDDSETDSDEGDEKREEENNNVV